jgi:hypothetical protein
MTKEFKNLILKKKVSEINKITLKKIFYLINFVLEVNEKIPNEKKDVEKKIEEFLTSSLFDNKLENIENDETKKSIINIRIRSIMQTEDWKEYKNKKINDNYSIYNYEDKSIIYIKNKNIKKEEISLEIKDYNDITLIGKDKKKKIKFKNFFKEDIELKNYNKIVLKNTTL